MKNEGNTGTKSLIKETKAEFDLLLNLVTNLSTLDKEDLHYVEILVNEIIRTKH